MLITTEIHQSILYPPIPYKTPNNEHTHFFFKTHSIKLTPLKLKLCSHTKEFSNESITITTVYNGILGLFLSMHFQHGTCYFSNFKKLESKTMSPNRKRLYKINLNWASAVCESKIFPSVTCLRLDT